MTLIYLSGLTTIVVLVYGGWHWVLGTDTPVVQDRLKALSVIYGLLFVAGVTQVAFGA